MVKRNQTLEDTSPLISYQPAGAWIPGNNGDSELPNYSAGTFMLTTTRDAKASFSFNGTGVWIYGAKRGNHGPYTGSIDGVASGQQDGYSAADQIQALLYSATNLPMGQHTVSIADSLVTTTAPYLDVDFIVWETEISDAATQPVQVLDDTDPNLQYSPPGEWTANQCTNLGSYSGTTCHITSSATASVKLTFNGDAVAIYGGVGPQYGPYTVAVDNQPAAQFMANNTANHAAQILYFASNLGGGNHTVTLSNDPTTPGNVIDIDSVQIIGGGTPSSVGPTTGGGQPTGNNGGTGSSNNGGGGTAHKSNTGAIVGGIIAAVVVVALAILGFFLWRRRRQRQTKPTVDLEDVHDPHRGMRIVEPTPYKPEDNSTNGSQTMFNPYNRPITGYTTQHTMSERFSDPSTPVQSNHSPHADSSFQHHQNRPSVTNLTSYTGDGSSASGPSVAGAGYPPISAVASPTEKGAQAYGGPTVRNDAPSTSPVYPVDAPPSYS